MTERENVKATLGEIAGVKLVATTWPKQFKELPCILLTMAGEKGADFRDDEEYLTEIEWYVRVFAVKEDNLLAVADAAQTAMQQLGYVRNLRWEEPGADLRQVALRFTKTI